MGNVKFYLKEPKANQSTIFMVFYLNNKRIKYQTDEKVNPEFWDAKLQRAKELKEMPITKRINKNLSKYDYFMDTLIESAKIAKKPIDSVYIKSSLDKEFKTYRKSEQESANKGDIDPAKTFMGYIDLFIEQCNSGLRTTPKSTKYKEWSIKGFTTLKYHLNAYQTAKKVKLDFNDITMDFYANFCKYFNDDDKRLNTIGKSIKNLKTIMAAATEDKVNSNLDYLNKKFRVPTEKTDKISLSESELQKIYNLDLTKNKKLERVRDLFIISAYTALRFGDLQVLNRDHFVFGEDGPTLQIDPMKTGDKVIIPLKPLILDILNKYKGSLPRCLSNQNMNDYLKDIGLLAGLEELVPIKSTKGGVRCDETFKKYKLITTHTGRRSAATNMYNAGIPPISIMKITGHKTETAFMKYICITQKENASTLMGHTFFSS